MNAILNKYSFLNESYVSDMLGDFSKSTGLYIEAVDKDGNTLIKATKIEKSEFCKYIRSNSECKKKCKQSYKKACTEAFKWKEPYFFRCHAGLVMWCVPIIINNENIGSIICGQVLLWKPDEFTYEEMRQFNKDIGDFDKVKEKIDKLNVISADKTQAVANMLSTVVNYIVNINSDYISEQQNLNEWKNKIRLEIELRKKDNPNIYSSYEAYLRKEKRLLQYMRIGEKDKAINLLPSLFTNISFLSNHNLKDVKIRCIELLSLISRALIEGGLDSQLAISKLEKYYEKINLANDIDIMFIDIETIVVELVDLIFILGKDRHTGLLRKARQYIVENYSKHILIEDVAEHVLISASYLSNLFKTKLNCTVNEYITRVRVEESIELMKDRGRSIQDISHCVGFSSASHFTKVFKKYIGVTPIHYRNKFL